MRGLMSAAALAGVVMILATGCQTQPLAARDAAQTAEATRRCVTTGSRLGGVCQQGMKADPSSVLSHAGRDQIIHNE